MKTISSIVAMLVFFVAHAPVSKKELTTDFTDEDWDRRASLREIAGSFLSVLIGEIRGQKKERRLHGY